MNRIVFTVLMTTIGLGCSGENQPKNLPKERTEEQIKAEKDRDAIINSGGKAKQQ